MPEDSLTPARPLRILVVHQYLLEDGGAGGSRWNELSAAWVADGHRVTVLAGMVPYLAMGKTDRYRGRYYHLSTNRSGVQVLRCHVSERYNASFAGRLWGYLSFMLSALWGGLYHLEGPFDVVVVSSPPLTIAVTGAVLAMRHRAPMVFEVRDLWPESAIDLGLLKGRAMVGLSFALERFAYARARLINVLTPAFARALVNKKGIAPSRILMIPNAADFSLAEKVAATLDREALRARLGWHGKFVALYVGAHGVANHLDQCLDAAAHLEGTPSLIVLLGEGMERERLRQEISRRGLTAIVQMGPVPKDEVLAYIMAADVGLSVLRRVDTFKTVYSNKTFDYMACRRAIVLAIDGVSRELVEQAGCGTYVEPEDDRALAAAIEAYRHDPERALREGESGYHNARAHFDRRLLARQYLEALGRVVRGEG